MEHHRLRTTTSAAIALTLLAALSACSPAQNAPAAPATTGKAGPSTSSVALAGVVANATDPFWATVMCGGTQEAKRLGVAVTWYTSPTTSAQTMSQNFSNALLTKPDGVFLNPFQATQFSSQVKTLMSQGVPVITSTPLDPSTERTSLPFATGGELYAAQIESVLPEEVGGVVALGGIPALDVLKQEWKPLEDAIAKAHPEATILPTQYTEFSATKTTQIVSSLLLAHPDLTMIIASTGPEGEGAAAAVKQAGKTGKVKIWAYDATPSEVAALQDGTITVLAAKPGRQMGAAAVRELARLAKAGGSGTAVTAGVPTKPLPLTIITKDTLSSPEAQAAVYKTTCGD